MKIYRDRIKRWIDVGVSLIGIIITSPIFIITAAAIKLDSPGDILFKQKRIGYHGEEFTIYKFRSMCMDAEKKGSGQYSFKGDPRVTRVGRVIRATSIDELPQFFNILKADMSLIGFRPPLTYHPWPIEQYTNEQRKMFSVRPGVTGWAQVHGRKEVQWEDRIRMGVWYAEHVSFWLDVKILLMTVVKVLSNANNENTVITTNRDD
ncbi:MAG: sugar transferase [Dorea sp.]|jgi:undecaprenyl phosphate N,N'-diacetylbacillosamine 1-phosphate transferase|nr:sugar transferase [Dorea sp.]